MTDRCFMGPLLDTDDHLGPDGRVMEVLSEHLCQGWLEGYLLTGRHGVFATYEAFAMVSASMAVQHVKWLQHAQDPAVAGVGVVAQRAAHLDVLAQRPQRLLAPGPGPHRQPHPARRRTSCGCGCRRTPTPRCRSPTTACAAPTTSTSSSSTSRSTCSTSRSRRPTRHCAAGAGVWEWASTAAAGRGPRHRPRLRRGRADPGGPGRGRAAPRARARPAGPLRQRRRPDGPAARERPPPRLHRQPVRRPLHADQHVVFAFHGYPRAVHQLVHGRSQPRTLPRARASPSRAPRRRRSTWSCSTG